jgi:hypothetical protein
MYVNSQLCLQLVVLVQLVIDYYEIGCVCFINNMYIMVNFLLRVNLRTIIVAQLGIEFYFIISSIKAVEFVNIRISC